MAVAVLSAVTITASAAEPDSSLPVRINNPVVLGAWQLPAERIGIGEAYKPSMAMLPGGELVMVAFESIALPNNKHREPTFLWRSPDNGTTWSQRQELKDVIGREQWLTCTSAGTLFMTSHILPGNIDNLENGVRSYLHRSTDGGRSWKRTKIQLTDESDKHRTPLTSRDIIELPDGTLKMGVAIVGTPVAYLWTSRDDGVTWEHSDLLQIGDYKGKPYNNADGFFGEDFSHLTRSGKILHWVRVGPPSPMHPINDGITLPDFASVGDNCDRSLLCESDDGGHTWNRFRDFGGYGVMYPRVLRLHDGRLMCTYTQRSLVYPIGLRAIISDDDGKTWDFNHDQIIIDGKTPWGVLSGGGFGNTLELADDKLISCYSYRAADQKSYVDVVRWRLPEKTITGGGK